MYETLLSLVNQSPKSFFYFGVGSCPHVRTPQELQPKYDQLLPCFVKDIAQNKNEKIQLLHIDPQFANYLEFLHAYFAIHLPDAIFCATDNIYIWETKQIQVICAATRFEHPTANTQENHEWFLDALTDEALVHGFRMVYQEYTGVETKKLFHDFYKICDENLKRRFRGLILFDVSYGNDIGCSTDMTKYKPIYEANGLFLNLQLLSNEELLEKVDVHPSIQEILRQNLLKDYRQTLNEIHVDYRRKMNGDPVFCPTIHGYDTSSTPSEIMRVLEKKLFKLVPLLQKVGLLSVQGTQKLRDLFLEYETIDRYKWYQYTFDLVKFEPPVNLSIPQ